MMRDLNIPQPLAENGGKKIKVELDKKALFALASDTRLDILKALQSNRRTVSQLAEEVGVDKAAVHRHLKKLEEGGFVTRTEDHGFVYYGLSWKARDIMTPGENTRIVILISSSLISVLGAIALVVWALTSSILGHSPGPATNAANESGQGPSADKFSQIATSPDHTWALILGAVLVVVAAVGIYLAWRKWRKPKLASSSE